MDINKISFSIQGSATSASKAIEKLVAQLNILNTSFNNVAKSGQGAVGVLSSIASLSGGATSGLTGMKQSATQVGKAMRGLLTTATTTATAVNNVSKSTKTTSASVATAIPKVNKLGIMFSSLHKKYYKLYRQYGETHTKTHSNNICDICRS